MRRRSWIHFGAVSIATISPAVAVKAQVNQPPASDAGGLQTAESESVGVAGGEIVVTARRREESIQRVPVSIVARTGEQLQQTHVDSLRELERVAPGLIIRENTGGANASVAIRGIGTTSADSNAIDPSVGIVIDGVVVERVGATLADFSDIERVEVLRGPQGTLFGKNSSAGLVSIITRDPTDTPMVEGRLELGSYDLIRGFAAVSGPLAGDTLTGRLSLYASTRDGFLRNLADGRDLNDDEQFSGRAKLRFTPGSNTEIKLTLYGLRRTQNLGASPARSLGPLTSPAETAALGAIAGPENDLLNGQGRSPSRDRVWGANLQWTQSLGDHSLISITGYQDWRWDYSPGTFVQAFVVPSVIERNEVHFNQRQVSEEIRLQSPTNGRIDYVAGLYLFRQEFDTFLDQRFQVVIVPNVFTIGIYNLSRNETRTLNYAGFGEINYRPLDNLTLTAGGRLSHEDKELFIDSAPPPPSTPTQFNVGLFGSAAPGILTDEVGVTKFSWRLGARWEPVSNHMLYATASRGFKGAGFNTNTGIAGVSQQVRPEVATSFEVGWKANLFDNRVRASLALFYTTVDDFQAQARAVVALPDGTNIAQFVLLNAGELRSRGVELAIDATPIDNLTINLSGAYVDARYERFEGAPCYVGAPPSDCDFVVGPTVDGTQNLSGRRLPGAPRFTASAFGRYDFPVSSRLNGFITADFSYRSSIQWSSLFAPFSTEGPVGLLGASLGIRDSRGRFELSLFGRNLTNKFYTNGINGGLGVVTHELPLTYQRTWGVVLGFRF